MTLRRNERIRLQAEATKLRAESHEEYLKASTDFKDSAAAVAKAIGVRLKRSERP